MIQYILYMPTDDIAHRLTHSPKKRMDVFRSLPLAERAAIFNTLSPHVRQEILKQLSVDETVELLDHLDLRRAQHILERMKDARRRRRIISRLKNDLHGKIEYFAEFHPQATAALVHLNYVLLSENTTIGDTAEIIKDYVQNTGKIPEVLVEEDGKLAGEVPLDTLVRERNTAKLGAYIAHIKTIPYTTPKKELLACLSSEPHTKVAILDADGSVIGIVYSDDVIDLLDASPAASLYSFAGVMESERPFDSAWSKMQRRYKWLILNLATAFLAAGVVALFEDTIAQIVLLAVYMPIIAGMGGNAATQTLAVMVRGIAVGEITLKNSRPAIIREVLAGLANGVLVGIIVALIALFFNQDPILGLVVGLAIVISMVIAGFAGTIIPLILRQLGKDPATSATIFITTATDVLGFFVFLGLARAVLL